MTGRISRTRRIRQAAFLALLAVAVVGPWIVPYDPLRPDPFAPLSPPSAEHWFGTNHLGMDVFSRVVAAARVDFTLALLGVLIGGGLGSVMGAWAESDATPPPTPPARCIWRLARTRRRSGE